MITIIQWIKTFFNGARLYVMIVLLFIAALGVLHNKIITLNKENAVLVNNNIAYEKEIEGLSDSLVSERVSFELTVRELNQSNNKIVQELNSMRKELGIKDKQIKELRHFNSTIELDTTVIVNVTEKCEFDTVIEYNPQTIFKVSLTVDDEVGVLKHTADISGNFNAYTYTSSEWKESNFFKRLFLFRWKKYHYESNVLVSDNEHIKIKDFKVIKIND